ncbi:hypothetical protein K5I29_00650 [Flavobacterium agricola]|uniref:WG repeat protein n=1 Tax=Flavobacterium agricola TaxID=2870839 RepID=A0ABY6M1G8_9FLAO|nr:hypothetical protein [Flavobacterium agricola]UYW01494.1 hypothetical protein K5I29_00650 [Flavobacterium agricola]
MIKHILFFALCLGGVISYSQTANDELIQQLYKSDQAVRKELHEIINSEDQTNLYKKLDEMNKIDAVNQKIAFPLLDKYLENEIELSNESIKGLYYILQHSEFHEKYKPFVEIAFQKKAIMPNEYAQFIDRLLVRKKQTQLYGLQSKYWPENQDMFLFPLDKNYAANRKKIGLEMADYSNYKDEYVPVLLKKNEFAVFGHVKNKNANPIENVEVFYNNKKIAISNKKGFVAAKIKPETNKQIQLIYKKDGKLLFEETFDIKDNNWQLLTPGYIIK